MTVVLDCSPCYEGRPNFIPGPDSILPQEDLTRSRLFAGGTFFRSKLTVIGDSDFQGSICNSIALSIVSAGSVFNLIVYFEDVEVERYNTTQDLSCPTSGSDVAIPDLRSQLTSSIYISMPSRGTDELDSSGMDSPCLSSFSKTNMTGGVGPSENEVESIRTGSDRTIAFISTKENSNGTPVVSKTMIQWNYDTLQWIAYILDSDCAIPENRCP